MEKHISSFQSATKFGFQVALIPIKERICYNNLFQEGGRGFLFRPRPQEEGVFWIVLTLTPVTLTHCISPTCVCKEWKKRAAWKKIIDTQVLSSSIQRDPGCVEHEDNILFKEGGRGFLYS